MYVHIKTKITLRILKKILLLLLIAGGIVFLQMQSFRYYENTAGKIISVGLSLLVYLFIFKKVGLIQLLRDKEWSGTVQSRECKKATVIRGVVAHRGNIVDVMIAHWRVLRDDGEAVILPYETEVIADDYFKAGDRVRHYKGAKIIVREAPDEDDENLLCPLCGKMVMKPTCSFCKIRF